MKKLASCVLLCGLLLATFPFFTATGQTQEPSENKGAAAAWRAGALD